MAKQFDGITRLSTFGNQVVTDPLANALNVLVQAPVVEVIAAAVLASRLALCSARRSTMSSWRITAASWACSVAPSPANTGSRDRAQTASSATSKQCHRVMLRLR